MRSNEMISEQRAVAKSRRGGKRPGAGRPATGRDAVSGVRLCATMTMAIDGWAEEWGVRRSEAIRRLLTVALEVKRKRAAGLASELK